MEKLTCFILIYGNEMIINVVKEFTVVFAHRPWGGVQRIIL